MAPTPRRDGEATRQRLLRAALELFTTTGFRATTTPQIAERAGVAEGTIYRHFSSKEQLLNDVYRAAPRGFEPQLRVYRAIAAGGRVRAILRPEAGVRGGPVVHIVELRPR